MQDSPRRWPSLRPLGWLLLGFLGLELLVRLLKPVWQDYSPDDYALRVERCAQQPRDIVFTGGSPVSEGIDPAIVTPFKWRHQQLQNGFAVGLPGGTTTDVYYALQRACPIWPKVLLYGMAPSDLNDSRNEPHGPASLMTVADWYEAIQVRRDARTWLTKHFWQNCLAESSALWQSRYAWRMCAADWFATVFPGSCPEAQEEAQRQTDYATRLRTGNGYAPAQYFQNRAYSDMKAGGWVAPPFEYLAKYRTGSHLKYLSKLHERCQANNCELVILEMPLTKDLEDRHDSEVRQFREVLRQLCSEKKIPRLVATRTATELDDRHFADLIHLNSAGAERLSRWLKSELEHLAEGQP